MLLIPVFGLNFNKNKQVKQLMMVQKMSILWYHILVINI